MCNACSVISLLLQGRTFWWYLLLLYDVIMTSYCCQRYAQCLITTLCSSRTVHWHTAPRTCNVPAGQCTGTPRHACATVELMRIYARLSCLVTTLCSSRTVHWHTAPRMCNSWTDAYICQTFLSPTCGFQTAQISILWIMRSRLSCSIVSTTDKFIVVWMKLKWQLTDAWCSLEQSTFDRTTGQWWDRHQACVHAKEGHFEYSLWTDNVDFVHIYYIQCDLFDCYIFNYKIMPATLANTFSFILQGRALADLRCGGRF